MISARTGSVAAWFQSITLPAINLGLIMAAYITRVTRSAMLEVLAEDYVRTARAKGVPWRGGGWRHALRNALIPIITVIGLYLGILIGNSVLTEIVFNRPGPRQADRRRAQPARLHDAAGHDGDLHADRGAREPR